MAAAGGSWKGGKFMAASAASRGPSALYQALSGESWVRRNAQILARAKGPVAHMTLINQALRRHAANSRSDASRQVNDAMQVLIDAGGAERTWDAGGNTQYTLTRAGRDTLSSVLGG